MKSELFRALAVIAEGPGPSTESVAAALELDGQADAGEYTDLFLLQLWPYASIYVGPEGRLGGEARDRIAGFWRALRLVPPAEPDHIAALLGLYASLMEREAAEDDTARRLLRRRSRHALLWEHLLSWLPLYIAKLAEIGSPFYGAWGALLGEALFAEATELGLPEQLPVHLRQAPPLTAPDDLLSPVRSGMVIIRDDLKRAARALGLGLRQGERIYVMKALLAQDAGPTLGWLADEARRWAHIHRSMPVELGIVRDFWAGRAEVSARMVGAQIPA